VVVDLAVPSPPKDREPPVEVVIVALDAGLQAAGDPQRQSELLSLPSELLDSCLAVLEPFTAPWVAVTRTCHRLRSLTVAQVRDDLISYGSMRLVQEVAASGSCSGLQFLLKFPIFDPAADGSRRQDALDVSLARAAETGKEDLVRYSLHAGANPCDEDHFALFATAMAGQAEVMKLLLEYFSEHVTERPEELFMEHLASRTAMRGLHEVCGLLLEHAGKWKAT
jgi:hypothetical protein